MMYIKRLGTLISMSHNKFIDEPYFLQVKTLTRQIVEKAGTTREVADLLRCSPGMVSNMQSKETHFSLSIFQLIALSRATQDYRLLDLIVETIKGEAVITGADVSKLMLGMSEVHKEASEFTQVTLEAVADQIITTREAETMLKEGGELVEKLKEVMGQISHLGGGANSGKMESTR